jgi:ABC-type polysaccharide/polyol phosphate export permease
MTEQTLNTTPAPAEQEEWPDEERPGALRILVRHRELIASLIYREIRARYKQSILGVAWAVINPIVMTVVYTLVFSVFLKVPTPPGIHVPYSVFVFTAIVPWNFFSQTMNLGTESLVVNFNLITKIYFPREVLLVALVLSKVVDLLLGLLVLISLYVICQVHVTWMVIFVIPALAIQLCLTLGVVLLLSSTNLFYRDIRHIVQLLTVVWMYMTPVIYGIERVPHKILPIYATLNPMVPVIETYKRGALMGQPPMWGYLGIAAVTSLVVLVVGYRVFKRLEPTFAEMV